jgi:hypothetical protein
MLNVRRMHNTEYMQILNFGKSPIFARRSLIRLKRHSKDTLTPLSHTKDSPILHSTIRILYNKLYQRGNKQHATMINSLLTALLLVSLASVGSATAIPTLSRRHLLVGIRRAIKTTPTPVKNDVWSMTTRDSVDINRGGGDPDSNKPPALLRRAYAVCGLATTAAWTAVVLTTIRSNQPLGAMMPTFQHGFFAQIGALSAVPLIVSSFATLASASKDSWEQLSSPTCRRHNLALVVAGVGSALWTGFAPTLTKIPGTVPLVSHQAYAGAMRAGLIGCYGSAAALSAAVWARSLPEQVRKNPLSWPGRVADGVAKSLVSLAPASRDDPVNVKYAILASSFLAFTGLQLVASHPLSVIPSWTGRRLARAFPAWTLLAAVSSFDLKEATENGNQQSPYYRTLSNGLRGFGALYLGAKVGAIFFDSSFPESYHAVQMVPGWAAAAIVVIGLTLRPDTPRNCNEESAEEETEKQHAI